MTAYRRHIEACLAYDPAKFAPFVVAGKPLGFVLHGLAQELAAHDRNFIKDDAGLSLDPALDNFATRSKALAAAAAWIAAQYQAKLRIEKYPVLQNWGDAPLAELDRAAVPWFGVRGFGVHVNGFVRKAGGIHLWVAERALDRLVDPGKLDNMIGGGCPIGLTVEENLAKEAWEEAGVPRELALTARPAGTLSYKLERMRGVRQDTLFVYDMDLPEDFMPRNTDGEVAAFRLMPLADVAAIIRDSDRFKFNCNLVIIDFLVRHDFITAADDEFTALKTALQPLRGVS